MILSFVKVKGSTAYKQTSLEAIIKLLSFPPAVPAELHWVWLRKAGWTRSADQTPVSLP
jgi:hypothetical protein